MIKNGINNRNDGASSEQLEEFRNVVVRQTKLINQLNTELIDMRGTV